MGVEKGSKKYSIKACLAEMPQKDSLIAFVSQLRAKMPEADDEAFGQALYEKLLGNRLYQGMLVRMVACHALKSQELSEADRRQYERVFGMENPSFEHLSHDYFECALFTEKTLGELAGFYLLSPELVEAAKARRAFEAVL